MHTAPDCCIDFREIHTVLLYYLSGYLVIDADRLLHAIATLKSDTLVEVLPAAFRNGSHTSCQIIQIGCCGVYDVVCAAASYRVKPGIGTD